MKKNALLVTFLLIATICQAQPNPFENTFPSIDRYIDSLMRDWNIPGLALGIVYKDELIYARGYGYRDLENKLPVQTTTIFPIGSNTKLFTATAACMLAEEGKLHLDKPVITYLPSLHFNNDELNAKVTMRDMLSHRTGLPRYDGIWVAYPLTRNDMIDKVALMKPQLDFREGYLYNNMMYAASAAVMERISGTSWEDMIRTKFFQPLQMNASCLTKEEMIQSGNFAYAYFEPDSTRRLQRVTFAFISNAIGPAGIIKSNIEDMSHWMIAQLNAGKYQGQQVIPQVAIKQTLIPNIIIDKEAKWNELSHGLYGLGRVMQSYKGYNITAHTGSIDGYYSNLTFVPSENIAVFMVHNSVPAGSFRPAMALPVVDRLLNLDHTPWSERYMKEYLKTKATDKMKKDSVMAAQVKNTFPSHPLHSYAGQYVNPIYGDMHIAIQNEQLLFIFRNQQSVLYHFHYDQFITREETHGKPDYRLNFLINGIGEIDRFTIQLGGDHGEFVKTK